jgi:sugar lactone lactonase YvrE
MSRRQPPGHLTYRPQCLAVIRARGRLTDARAHIGRCTQLALLGTAGLALCPLSSSAAAVVSPLRPDALALAPSGGLYVADTGRNQILERLPSGRFVVVAGTGKSGFLGDGGPASAAKLNNPGGMAVAEDGTLFFADQGNNRVRAISPAGRISTVVGDGRFGWVTTGTPALRSGIGDPAALAFGPDGRLYVAAEGSNEILRLNRDGTLARIAGGNDRLEGVVGVGRRALNGSPDGPSGLAFNSDGDLFIAGQNTKTLLMIDGNGVLRAPLGKDGFYSRGDGGLVEAADGSVIAMQTQSILQLRATGAKRLFSFANRRIDGIKGFLPNGIAISKGGTIYTDTDGANGWASAAAIVAVGPRHHVSVLWKR